MTIVAVFFHISASLALACDVGVFWSNASLSDTTVAFKPDAKKGRTWPKHMKKYARASVSDAADTWPAGANATSWSTTLSWEKANYDGKVFLSTTIDEGCGGGYIGAQIWGGNDTNLHVDWAIWDASDDEGQSLRNTRPMPDAISQTQCTRYDGEGFGTQCGINATQNLHWDFSKGNSYTFNVTLISSNASGAVFGANIHNDRSGKHYPIGQIYTAQPPPSKSHPNGYSCGRLIVGGGSFQEYFEGGSFTNIASYEGPRFRGVADHEGDVLPARIQDCFMHGTCHDGPEGCCNCHNETTTHCLPPDCEVARVTFMGGHDIPVPAAMIPPWDDHPHVQQAIECDFLEKHWLDGGYSNEYWGTPIMHDGVNASNLSACLWGDLAECATRCCGYCHADPDCVMATLHGNQCALKHQDSQNPLKISNRSDLPDNRFPVVIVKHRISERVALDELVV